MSDVLYKFREVMSRSGLESPELPIADSRFNRFGLPEDRTKKPCWYILTILPNDFAFGSFGCFKRDIKRSWHSKQLNSLSAEEKKTYQKLIKQHQELCEAEQQKWWAVGARKAKVIWDNSRPAEDHYKYLQTKSVQSFGLRIGSRGDLIIPVLNSENVLCGLQFISPDGQKKFLPGTKKKSSFYQITGDDNVIYISEGYSTAASIHQVTGNTVIVAFDAGNLLYVSKAISNAYTSSKIVIAADNDQFSEKNVGVENASEAAKAIGANIVVPTFKDLENKPTDFNDLFVLEGIDEVRKQLTSKVCVEQKSEFPADYYVSDAGIYFESFDKDGEPLPQLFICSRFEIVARTRDIDGLNHGRLLKFQDEDGKLHLWPMPMEMLATDGAEYRRILLSMGMSISSGRKQRELLTNLIQSVKPEESALCTDSVGWYEKAFILPNETIGKANIQVYLQSCSNSYEGFECAGSLAEWREKIARVCEGSSRLVFAVSIAFAAPLLYLLGEENGGFHFRGASSSGKTTALRVACSVWGSQIRLQRWRATSNGLESVAKLHNDSLLCLDELAQVSATEAGEVAYMLANGSGKIRSKQKVMSI